MGHEGCRTPIEVKEIKKKERKLTQLTVIAEIPAFREGALRLVFLYLYIYSGC
jgi:hypothetical protein